MKRAGRGALEARTTGPWRKCSLPALRSAAAAVARGALLGLIHPQRPPAQLLAVDILDRARGVGARHLNEPEAARPAGVAIGDDAHRLDGAVRREQLADLGVSRGKWQVANIDLRHAIKLLKRNVLAGAHAELGRRRTYCHLVENDSAFQTRKPTRKRGGRQAAGKGKVTNRRGRYPMRRARHK